ncbi:MAG: hypothetical protein AAGL49_05010, partial [Pseudomonadota bacterium]
SFALLATGAIAFADDFESRCVEISMNETLPEGLSQADVEAACACLAGQLEENPSLTEEFTAGLEIADYDERVASLSEAGQAAVEACSG